MHEKIISSLFGAAHQFPLEQRIVTMAAFLVTCTGFLSTIQNFIVSNPLIHFVFSILAIAGGAGFYFWSRFRTFRQDISLTMVFFFLLLLSAGWLPTAGSFGSSPFFFYMLAVFSTIVLKGKIRLVILVLVVSIILVFFYLEYNQPAVLTLHQNAFSRYLDVSFNIAFCIIITVFLVYLIVDEFRNERRQNAELLIESLESRQALARAAAEIKTLKGFLPICAGCKKIRDDEGYWQDVASYLTHHTNTVFSHCLCPECSEKLYPEYHTAEDTGTGVLK